VAKVMTEKPASIRRLRERVPQQVEDAVLTALEKLPADRFGSAGEFAQAITSTSSGRFSVARPAGTVARGPSRGRSGLYVGLGAAFMLALLGGTFVVGRR